MPDEVNEPDTRTFEDIIAAEALDERLRSVLKEITRDLTAAIESGERRTAIIELDPAAEACVAQIVRHLE